MWKGGTPHGQDRRKCLEEKEVECSTGPSPQEKLCMRKIDYLQTEAWEII